ncbi:methyltransferase domain-containing protein [Candidatus Woesearchaeota archaeon]|nr:methyltransferase domain-containing protein [Candidatus Woesearchaeota archaeon]
MNPSFLQWLRCAACRGELKIHKYKQKTGKEIVEGLIRCISCKKEFPIVNGIPRMVPKENYADSFGMEWNLHLKTMLDSATGKPIIYNTVVERTGWDKAFLKNKLVLECGCGAGIDSEILLQLGAKLISFDLSTAVDAAFKNNHKAKNLVGMFQGDITNIPLLEKSFDIVYCHRVLQHTPNPHRSFVSMAKYVKPKGTLFMHSYDNTWKNMTHWRYLYRPITKRMNQKKIYSLITKHGPFLHKLTTRLDQYYPGRVIHHFFIPFHNYSQTYGKKYNLTPEQLYDFEIMNTFDSLSPRYDQPTSPKIMQKWFKEAGFEKIMLVRRNPVIMKGIKS